MQFTRALRKPSRIVRIFPRHCPVVTETYAQAQDVHYNQAWHASQWMYAHMCPLYQVPASFTLELVCACTTSTSEYIDTYTRESIYAFYGTFSMHLTIPRVKARTVDGAFPRGVYGTDVTPFAQLASSSASPPPLPPPTTTTIAYIVAIGHGRISLVLATRDGTDVTSLAVYAPTHREAIGVQLLLCNAFARYESTLPPLHQEDYAPPVDAVAKTTSDVDNDMSNDATNDATSKALNPTNSYDALYDDEDGLDDVFGVGKEETLEELLTM